MNDVEGNAEVDGADEVDGGDAGASDPATQAEAAALAAPEQPAPATPARLEPQRYKVQFTASEEYVKLVEEAQALLSHSAPRATLDEIHLRAMRAFVQGLKRQKYAVTTRPRKRSGGTAPAAHTAGERADRKADRNGSADEAGMAERPLPRRRRRRHVPAAIRRAVFERDAGRCTYVDAAGRRCRETHGLELHHSKAFAQGGEHTAANLTLRCHAHNALAAEEDFGKDFIELKRDSLEHESARRAKRGDGYP